MTHSTRFLYAIALLTLVLLATGCGNKGDLYRPEDVVKKVEAADAEKDEEQ